MKELNRKCSRIFMLWICFVAPVAWGSMRLEDVTALCAIGFKHTDGASGKYHIIEPMSAGLALFDFDSDGDIDIYFLNGAGPESKTNEDQPRNALYRNDGAWRFTDVTTEAGVGDTHFGLGVTVADYDNDGDPDLYLNNHGPNRLYRNNGDGSFTDVTVGSAVGEPPSSYQREWPR